MAKKQEQKTAISHRAQPATVDEKLRALVRTLAKMAAETDYEASKPLNPQPPKGSS